MNYILYLSTIFMIPIMYAVMINQTKFKKNIALEVTFPYEMHDNKELLDIIRRFKRAQLVCSIALAISGIVFMLLIKNISLNFFIWTIWLLFIIIFPTLILAFYNVRLKEIKERYNLNRDDKVQKVFVSITPYQREKYTSIVFFISLLLCIIAAFIDRTMYILHITMALTTILYYLIYRYAYRNKSEMIDENIELTKALSQIRHHHWTKLFMYLSVSNVIFSISAMLYFKSPIISSIIFVLAIALLLIISIKIEFKLRAIQEKLTKNSGQEWYVDEDKYWPYGLFYYNKNDNNLIINNRVGLNSTVNLAKPAGKFIMAITLISLIALPVIGIMLPSYSSGPISIEVSDSSVVSKRKKADYTLDLNNIEDAKILEEVPKGLRRIAGTSMPNFLKGRFTSNEYSKMRIQIDPTVKKYILIKNKNDDTFYLFNTRDFNQTESAYQSIIARLKERR